MTDDGRLAWTSMADMPDDADPILLGLDESGRPHFAALLNGMRVDNAPAMRSPALMAVLAALAPGEAEVVDLTGHDQRRGAVDEDPTVPDVDHAVPLPSGSVNG